MELAEQKANFIKALASYLVKDQARKSIELQMGKDSAKEWALLRNQTNLHGYPTVSEAEAQLTKFLA